MKRGAEELVTYYFLEQFMRETRKGADEAVMLCATPENVNHIIDENDHDHVLCYAFNRHETVIHLLKLGADPNATTHDGHTVLWYWASLRGYKNFVNALIDHGADVNKKIVSANTYSACKHTTVLVELCMDLDAMLTSDVRQSFSDFCGDLYACLQIMDNIRLLIDRGANPESDIQFTGATHPETLLECYPWIEMFVECRWSCRRVCIVLIGIVKHRLSPLLASKYTNMDVVRLASKHVWSTRMEDRKTDPLAKIYRML